MRMSRGTVNVNPPLGGRYTYLFSSRRDTIYAPNTGKIEPMTGKMFGTQKSQGPPLTAGMKTITKRMQNRIIPLG